MEKIVEMRFLFFPDIVLEAHSQNSREIATRHKGETAGFCLAFRIAVKQFLT